MRAIIPLAILVVPGAVHAQSADPMLPGSIAQWSDEQIAPVTGFAQFAEQISPAAILAEPADDALTDSAPALPVVAFAEAAPLSSPLVPVAPIPADVAVSASSDIAAADAGLAPADAGATASEIIVTAAAEAADASADAADMDNAGAAPVALADQADALFAGAPVSEGVLADTAGKAGLGDNALLALVNSSGNINNNTIGDNSKTGTINISDTAFSNVNGFALVNVNTGNQSIINSGMSVVLQINYASQ